MSHLLISAAHKSSGKTTISIGLCAALRQLGQRVQPFKKGPDYIDPLWLGQAAGQACYNLDFYTMSHAEILRDFVCHSQAADISLIEANKGLYDGLDLDGSNSNAALAHLLHAPVLLVLSTLGMTRGIAPLILGYQAFDQNLNIAGVILNQVGGVRHESKLRAIIEHYTDVKVLGAVHKDQRLAIDERHLGLMPSNENAAAQDKIAEIAALVAQQVDLPAVLALANTPANTPLADAPACPDWTIPTPDVRLGVLQDAAFGFYYAGDLHALRRAGAELVPINALQDTHLPTLDGLFIGGGFPETQAQALAANIRLRTQIRQAIEEDLPVYAECGGLMYLGRNLHWGEHSYPMVGALPLDTRMYEKPQGRGYVRLQETGAGLWPLLDEQGQPTSFQAHEFHYSSVENLQLNESLTFAYNVLRGQGIDGEHDGLVYRNTLASYVHLRDLEANHWTQRFVDFVKQHRKRL